MAEDCGGECDLSMSSTLSSRLIACLYLFERVCSRCDKIIAAQHDPLTFYYGDDDESTGIPTLFEQYASSLEKFLPVLQDEHGRLRVWTGNIGAHKSRRSSLDYRLRDASQVRGQVASLLDVLEVSLSEGKGCLFILSFHAAFSLFWLLFLEM